LRGKTIEIEVKNPEGVCRGVRAMTLNGRALAGNLLPADQLGERNRVNVVLGQCNE
jgi:cellobiose phosphorylase